MAPMAPTVCADPAPIPPAILSPDDGHGAAFGRADVGRPLAPLGDVSRGGAVGPTAVPPPLPAGPGGAPRVSSEESLLLVALPWTLWRLSYQRWRRGSR